MEDVWEDADRPKWDMLCGPLEFGKPGSRILLTTRLDTVVRMVGKTIDVLGCWIKLKDLPKVEYLSLFNKCAFDDEEHNVHLNLAEIRKQIAVKLEGSLLATKTVASLLMENLYAEHWKNILSSDIENCCNATMTSCQFVAAVSMSLERMLLQCSTSRFSVNKLPTVFVAGVGLFGYMLPYFCEVRMVTPRNGMVSEPGVWADAMETDLYEGEWDADSNFENEWYTD